MAASDDLRAEYLLLQGQYEAFDQRALSLKALATPLLGAGLAAGVDKKSVAILVATVFVALSLWVLEAMWKNFQYCLVARIKLLEAWFAGTSPDRPAPAPFQIYTWWARAWERQRDPRRLLPILAEAFVFLPYLPMILIGAAGAALVH